MGKVSQSCRTCRWWRDHPLKRAVHAAVCNYPAPPLPTLPASMAAVRWPPSRVFMWPKEGASCAVYESAEEVEAERLRRIALAPGQGGL